MPIFEHIDPMYAQPELSENDVLLRREFVKFYMHSRDPIEACVKIGFAQPYATDFAKSFMDESFVQKEIQKAELQEETEEHKVNETKRLKALLNKEATFYGQGANHGSRVSAIIHLMKLEGMEPVKETKVDISNSSGVMVVPALTTPDQWGEFAQESQNKLKSSVKD